MPIDIESFTIAKDPTNLILKFLRDNAQNAFTLDEIYDKIEEFKNLNIPKQKLDDSLTSLIRNDRVETAVLNDKWYVAIKKR